MVQKISESFIEADRHWAVFAVFVLAVPAWWSVIAFNHIEDIDCQGELC